VSCRCTRGNTNVEVWSLNLKNTYFSIFLSTITTGHCQCNYYHDATVICWFSLAFHTGGSQTTSGNPKIMASIILLCTRGLINDDNECHNSDVQGLSLWDYQHPSLSTYHQYALMSGNTGNTRTKEGYLIYVVHLFIT